MVSRDFSGREIVNVLQKFGYRHDRTRGDHAILIYNHPETGEKRTVTVPLHDRVRTGTLQSIADTAGCNFVKIFATPGWRNSSGAYSRQYEQCGAKDFHAWCRWIDNHR